MPVRTTRSSRSPNTRGGVADGDVGPGAQAAHLGLVGEREQSALADAQVLAAGGDQGRRRRHALAAAGLAHGQAGGGVEPRSQRSGEAGGHVLDDHGAGAERRRQGRHERGERLGAAGRARDHDRARPARRAAAGSARAAVGRAVAAAARGRRDIAARHILS